MSSSSKSEHKPCCSNITRDPIQVSVSYPGSSCYFLVNFASNIFGSCNPVMPPLNGYCSADHIGITPGQSYTCVPVSTYDEKLLSVLAYYDVHIYQNNIRKINYIINNIPKYVALGYTTYSGGDIQVAIWTLINIPPIPSGDLGTVGPYTQANVDAIVADANANGSNYVPCSINDSLIVIFIPVGVWPNDDVIITYQLILGVVKLCNLFGTCYMPSGYPC